MIQKLRKSISLLSNSINTFKTPFQFYINSEKSLKSGVGTICSLIILTVTIFMFFTSDMLDHKNPKISDQILASRNASIKISNENLAPVIFFTEMIFSEGKAIIKPVLMDPSFIKFSVKELNYHESSSKFVKDLPVHRCQSEDFDSSLEMKSHYENGYCFFKRNESMELQTKKSYWFDDMNTLYISLEFCSNETFNNSCKPRSEILDYIKGKFFGISFIESSFNSEDFEKPETKIYGKSIEIVLSSGIQSSNFLEIMETEIILDDSFWMGSVKKEKYVQESQRTLEIAYENSEDSSLIAEFFLRGSFIKRVIKRRYQKLPELLSVLGGLSSLLHFFFAFVTNFFSQRKSLLLFINNLYKIPCNNHQKTLLNIEKEEVSNEKKGFAPNVFPVPNSSAMTIRNKNDIKIEMETNNSKNNKDFVVENKINSPSVQKNNSQFDFIEIMNQSMKKKPPFVISILEYILYTLKKFFSCPKNLSDKEKLIAELEEKEKKELDIYNILKKIKEIEILKEIIFNKRQLELFNCINKSFLIREQEKTADKNQENVFLVYEKNKNTKILDKIDKRLFSYLKEKN